MHDDELAGWRNEWQDEARVPDATRLRAIAGDRRYRAWVAIEYVLTGLLLAGALAYALYAGDLAAWTMFAGIWGIGLPTFAYTVWNRRGLWRAADTSGRAFLALAQERCRRGLRLLHASYAVLAAVVLFNVAVFIHVFHAHDNAQAMRGIVITLVVAVVMLAVFVIAHRRLRRRREALAAVAKELDL